MADTAGVAARLAGAEQGLALHEHDVGDAASGEMKGDARAHASAAYDHDIRRLLHEYKPAGQQAVRDSISRG